MYVCMYVCMYGHHIYSRVWINRVRLPILLVVSWTGEINLPLSPCVPENLVSRDGFSRPVPLQPAHLHTLAESGAYLRDSSRVPRRRPIMKPPYAIGSVPSCTTVVMLGYDWWLCMVINISVQHNGGFLPDIILLTQGYYHWRTRLNTM